METITDRICRYLLRRIRRLAVLELYASAATVGILDAYDIDGLRGAGTIWRIAEPAADFLSGDPVHDKVRIANLLKRSTTSAQVLVSGDGLSDDAKDHSVEDVLAVVVDDGGREKGWHLNALERDEGAGPPSPSQQEVLAHLRPLLPKPAVVSVAVALLIARAVGESLFDLEPMRRVLRTPHPFILVKAPVAGFERHVGCMLEEGLIAPFWASLTDVLGGLALSENYGERRNGKVRRKIATASGKTIRKTKSKVLRRNFTHFLIGKPMPLLVADETPLALTEQVVESADLVLECAGFDRPMIAELLFICLGIAPTRSLSMMDIMKFNPAGLGLDDLTLGIRPNRNLGVILRVLMTLAKSAEADDEADGETDNSDREWSSKSSRSKSKTQPTLVEIIEPVAEVSVEPSEDQPKSDTVSASAPHVLVPRVETLAGYGEARPWALDLKDDLKAWRDGLIGWDQMSTKMVLSGPPGTGKTSYAKALCNTLQVPLIISSVATWLEPGYLGDVLQRMSATFEAARRNAPCILFIDELDGIGSRGRSHARDHDDYWVSLINRLLELLDGALKSEGVIVVAATNLPGKIDPALLRSGRLEKHVVIPLPDTQALQGILSHHLGHDLAAVLASAPEGTNKAPAKPTSTQNTSQIVRSEASSAGNDTKQKGPLND